jgi:hypothetical protein
MALTTSNDPDQSAQDDVVTFNATFDEDYNNLSRHVSAEAALREPGVYEVGYGTETLFIEPGFP